MIANRYTGPVIGTLALLWLAMLFLGGAGADRSLLLEFYAADAPWLALAAMAFTYAGNGIPLMTITALAAGWLFFQKRGRAAFLLLFATLSGRLLVVVEKLLFSRLRPEEEMRLVEVSSLSFPSGHAANSVMVFLAMALLIPRSEEGRRRAVAGALFLSFLVGLSRPMLGVHWPSDVVGGWAFGVAWLLLVFHMADRWWPEATTVRR